MSLRIETGFYRLLVSNERTKENILSFLDRVGGLNSKELFDASLPQLKTSFDVFEKILEKITFMPDSDTFKGVMKSSMMTTKLLEFLRRNGSKDQQQAVFDSIVMTPSPAFNCVYEFFVSAQLALKLEVVKKMNTVILTNICGEYIIYNYEIALAIAARGVRVMTTVEASEAYHGVGTTSIPPNVAILDEEEVFYHEIHYVDNCDIPDVFHNEEAFIEFDGTYEQCKVILPKATFGVSEEKFYRWIHEIPEKDMLTVIGWIPVFGDYAQFEELLGNQFDASVYEAILDKASFTLDSSIINSYFNNRFDVLTWVLILNRLEYITTLDIETVFGYADAIEIQQVLVDKCSMESPLDVFGLIVELEFDEEIIENFYERHRDSIPATPEIIRMALQSATPVFLDLLSRVTYLNFDTAELYYDSGENLEPFINKNLVVKVTQEQSTVFLGTVFEPYISILVEAPNECCFICQVDEIPDQDDQDDQDDRIYGSECCHWVHKDCRGSVSTKMRCFCGKTF